MIKRLLTWWNSRKRPAVVTSKPKRARLAAHALLLAKIGTALPEYKYPIKPPDLFPGVAPAGTTAPVMALDDGCYNYGAGGGYSLHGISGFPGYPHLAMLATRAEYRAFASSLSTAITREWIELNSSETAGDSTKKKITELTKALKDLGLQQVIQTAVEHDCLFGRAQIFIGIDNQDRTTPLILSSKTIPKNAKISVKAVEAMWTTPLAYNAIDPAAADFYKPNKWYMLGQEVHATRLLTVITRPLPDMLKPAYNFGGISQSQLAEPYVDNWLRTRQSVSDLISNFSITALKTKMEQVLTGGADADEAAEDLYSRAEMFTNTRSNRGLMLIDKDSEELVQTNTPLSGLHELQAQSQEQMCSVGKTPCVILLGVAPSGFGNVAEGEIRTWEDWVKSQWEAFWRSPIETVFKVLQFSMYGEVDEDISISFNPLHQMTDKELAEIRVANSTAAANYIDRQVIAPEEERERLARDPESGYEGLDTTKVPTPPQQPEEGKNDEGNDE